MVLDRAGLEEAVVERLVEEKLKSGFLYTETTGSIPLSFHTTLSENGSSAILLCFSEEVAIEAVKAIRQLEAELRSEIEQLSMLKARLQLLRAGNDAFARNGIEVVE